MSVISGVVAFRANRRGKNVSLGPKSRTPRRHLASSNCTPTPAWPAEPAAAASERVGCVHGAIPRSRRGVFAPVDDMGDETASSQKAPLLTEAQPEAPAPG